MHTRDRAPHGGFDPRPCGGDEAKGNRLLGGCGAKYYVQRKPTSADAAGGTKVSLQGPFACLPRVPLALRQAANSLTSAEK